MSPEGPTGPNSSAGRLFAETFLAKNPEAATIDILLPDVSGVVRGKRVGRDQLAGLFEEGAAFPASVFGTDVTGDSVDETGLVWELGDADYPCWPVPGTLMPVPWTARPSAQVLLTMTDPNGAPFFAEPRVVLQRVFDRYKARGLTPVVALELEFYLIDRKREDHLPPIPAMSPVTGARQATTQVYGLDELDDFEAVLDDVANACRVQGIPAMAASAEYAPGQFEINLTHEADPVQAADHAVLLKRAVKGVARAHGMNATFMAKPFSEETGNGLHLHVSVLGPDGKNIFADPKGGKLGSPALSHAVGGLAATMNDCMALFAPTANAYKRLRPANYVPMSACWGYNNRSCAFRVPAGSAAVTRIEHRVAGADANPYLATAAVLAGMLHGIETEAEAPRPIDGNAYETEEPSVPKTWSAALDCFESSAFVANWLGADFQRVFHAVKEAERRDFEAEVTPLEWRWYLTTI
ncbi:glutamine synthetase family protein [Thalassobaculum sp.]|uniref:glutamine synthetase family protein n=1 Tax=Thalassobaculum sp. TaxID=2022740 RepID=UPI0032F01BC3